MMIAVVVAGLVVPEPALAQGKLDARYTVTLSGLPIGRGAWVIDIADDQFTAAASGTTTGLLRVFSKGQGTGATRGLVVNGTLVGATFAASISSDKKTEEIRLSILGGVVKELAVSPPPDFNPERVPVTEAHRRNVMDPMTATLFRVPGNGSVFGPDACPAQLSAFDGRLRYDLRTAFKRLERVKADRGYEGLAVVCAVYFVPIAGHVPSRYVIRYLAEQREAEAWLVPIAGTRVMVPFRVSLPTPLGPGVMQATQFLTVPQPPRAAKTQ
jgi:hypothetical protein